MQTVRSTRKKTNEFAEELLDLSNKLTGIPHQEIDNAITATITRLGLFLRMDHAFVVEIDVNQEQLLNRFEWCNEGVAPLKEKLINTSFAEVGSILEKLSKNECIILPSIKKDMPKNWKLERELFEKLTLQSLILFPVMKENSLVGYIGIDSFTEAKKYTTNEIYLLKVWGSMLSALIKNKRSEVLIESMDMTKIRLSEDKFYKAFHTNPALIVISNLEDAKYVDVNDAFLHTMEYDRSEVIGKTSYELGLMTPALRETFTKSIQNHQPVKNIEIKTNSKSGKSLIGLLSCDSIWIENRYCLITVIIDITERKTSELALQKAREEAVLANRAKSDFLSRMSHELRTPLNSIIGFAQLLEIGSLMPQQEKCVAHIRASGDYLLNLINEILDISRIESGRLKLNLETISIKSAIFEILDVVHSHGDNKSISFNTELTDDAFQICTDVLRFKQIMLNLLNNAVKYNREGGKIFIKAEPIIFFDSGKSGVRISVRDNGYGIHPDKIPLLFNPFERAGAEYSETEGTGLGLAVVKKLVEALGGDVFVKSELHVGSTFWIELPESSQDMHAKSIGNAVNNTSPKFESKGRIIYVEDNYSNIEVFEMMLKNLRPGIELNVLETGKNLVNIALETKPDLILLDLNLPDVSGEDLCDALKANDHTKHIPIVILSADAMESRIKALLQKDVKHYLTKPFVIKKVLGVIDEFISPS